ncbi:formate dehydrogenase accessory sulfurtransferase FdhD [Protofrankia coriariae]|uniref:formate dehydrogenase accessory sulfurtransferase FdhD n=1 Tax=Protofrankia coriariae TaxID=1562887 RepID=UPI000A323A90|nr:formate dehydrogenase accessory sulfurtransferase FdhD [Protofrankia coriariae]
MGRVTVRRQVLRIRADGGRTARPDSIAGEEPLELRVAGRSFVVTMRTPGHDVDLAFGFLVGEGIIGAGSDVLGIRYCAGTNEAGGQTHHQTYSQTYSVQTYNQTYNVLDITLAPTVPPPDASLQRAFYTSSSCGLCGKASIEGVRLRGRFTVDDDPLVLRPQVVLALPERLRAAQKVFASTGGLHAAGIADAAGNLLVVREDVGRHNAVDKVVGHAAREGALPLRGRMLVVSGRASFELTQKALLAGIPALVAVSAPSSLAVELAADAGMTLIGFVRGDSMNVYTGAHRVGAVPAVQSGPLP